MQHFSRSVQTLVKESRFSATNRILALLIQDWGQICGSDLLPMTLPFKLTWSRKHHSQDTDKKQAILHVLCPDALKTKIMFQEALWLDRANRLLGNDVLIGLRTHQHDDWEAPSPQTPNPLSQKATETENMDHIKDPDLRHALERMAQAIASSNE